MPPVIFKRSIAYSRASFYLTVLATALVSTCLLSQAVEAYNRKPQAFAPACEKISKYDVIFVGQSIEVFHDQPPNGNAKATMYRFRVDRCYKGLPPSVHEVVVTPYAYGECGQEYPTGKTFLIFARFSSRDPLTLTSGECTGSRLAEYARADIDFLESHAQGKTETAVYGQVLQFVTKFGRPSDDDGGPLMGAAVSLRNADHTFETVSEFDGGFRFSGIPAGDYELWADLDPYVSSPSPYHVSVREGECKEFFIPLEAQSRIEGVLLGPDQKPIRHERVELLRLNEKGTFTFMYRMWADTNDQGEFSFLDLESGDYLLGHAIWYDAASDSSAFPTWYFPGVAERANAQFITVAPRQILKDLTLTLPSPQTPRKFTITVKSADGSEIGDNLLQIMDRHGLVQNLDGAKHGATITFLGYQERAYEFTARYWIDNLFGPLPIFQKRVAKSDPITVAPGSGPVDVVLVLSHEQLGDN